MKKIISIFVFLFVLIGIISFVSANDEVNQAVPFSLSSWFKHIFGIQEFSIVGDYRQCDRYPQETFTYQKGEAMIIDVKDYCSSGHGLIDFYTGGWNPVLEMKDRFVNSGCNIPPCNIEVYCCPHEECSRDRDCEDWYGDGSECKSRLANDPNINYAYSTFSYCTEPSGIEVTCWYKSNEVCKSRRYIGDEYCPATYMNLKLYNSKSACETTPEEPIQINGEVTCASQGAECELYCEGGKENIGQYDCGIWKSCCKVIGVNGNGVPTDGVNGNGNGNGEVPTNGEGATISFDYGELSTLTSASLEQSICSGGSGCPANSKCIIISSLVSDGYVTEEQMKVTREDFCQQEREEGIWHRLWDKITDSDYWDTCGKLIGKDKFFRTHYGFCMSGEEPSFLEDFLEDVSFGIKITGNKTTDGLIVIGGILVLLFLLTRMLVFGDFGEYELNSNKLN